MSEMWMDVDAALSEVPVNLVALIDDTNFKSREESVVFNQAGLDLLWNFTTTAGVFTQTAVTPTDTGGDYDWVNQGNGYYTIEIPASGGASINNDTEGFGFFSGFATGILPWRGPVIGFRAAALNNALIDGGDLLDVSVTQWLGTAAASPTTAGVPSVSLTAIGLDDIVSTAVGMVEIAKAVWDRILSGATHNIASSAGRRLRAIQDFGQYLGSVHIDTVNGTAGTVVDENGTADNPVDSLADAITLNTTLGFNVFTMSPSSSITLAQTFNNFLFEGKDGWTLALGGQDIGGTHFIGADATGIGTGSTEFSFERCNLGTATLHPFHAENCGLSGTITFGLAGDYLLGVCHSRIAGATTPIIDTGAALLNVNLAMPDYSNGIEIRNLNAAGTDEFSISGIGQIIYAASSSGTVNQRGDWQVTNTGGVTIAADDNTTNAALILADTADMQPKLGTPAANISADIAAIPTTAMRGTDGANTTTPPTAAANATAVLTTQMAESYAANGVAPTLAQAQFALHQMLMQFGISGTNITVRKLDDSTTAFIVTLDDDTNPTDAKRV